MSKQELKNTLEQILDLASSPEGWHPERDAILYEISVTAENALRNLNLPQGDLGLPPYLGGKVGDTAGLRPLRKFDET